MKIRKAQRRKSKLKLGIQGPAGSGKTYSSLLLAKGLISTWDKVCIIDTENGSADLYDNLGNYLVLPLQPPYTPERFVHAITAAENSKAECLIIDSFSMCWEYLVHYHAKLTGNSFTNWSKIMPRYKALLAKILSSDCHIIVTLRTKQDYILTQNAAGKLAPKKVGLKSIAKDGTDYEWTILFEIDINHTAIASKDRTGLFNIDQAIKLSEATGSMIAQWCDKGIDLDRIKSLITNAESIEVLNQLYTEYNDLFHELQSEFITRKTELTITSPLKPSLNGTSNQ